MIELVCGGICCECEVGFEFFKLVQWKEGKMVQGKDEVQFGC